MELVRMIEGGAIFVCTTKRGHGLKKNPDLKKTLRKFYMIYKSALRKLRCASLISDTRCALVRCASLISKTSCALVRCPSLISKTSCALVRCALLISKTSCALGRCALLSFGKMPTSAN